MNAKDFWRRKLVMLLHDPPGKPFFLRAGTGGHHKVTAELFQRITGKPFRFSAPGPDHAAAGADRPVVSPPIRTKGVSPIQVDWVSHPVLTHPLASGVSQGSHLDLGRRRRPGGSVEIRKLADELIERYPEELRSIVEDEGDAEDPARDEAVEQALNTALSSLPLWDDEARLQEACLWLWRRWPESPPRMMDPLLWRHQPADSRTPDHSLWDHTRVTSALAFMKAGKREGAQMPWLLAFSIGPVQRFIQQSRTGTDLWTSSMLLSDLIWHAMQPIVERYGPEAVVYPDLRKNPRADLWLVDRAQEKRWSVLEESDDPCSYAGIFPNTFIALVPFGGEGVLLPLQEIAALAKASVENRWKELSELAYRYWVDEAAKRGVDFHAFRDVWERQQQEVLFAIWSAAAWPAMEKVTDADAYSIRDALPAQSPAPPLTPEDAEAVKRWNERHLSWIAGEDFARYAEAKSAYAHTNLRVHQLQRGFDYSLIHHALFTRHALRKGEASGAILDERGEKCSLCGERQALGLRPGEEERGIDGQRESVKEVWAKIDPNSDGGVDHLCAVCAMKRVLIRAGKRDGKAAGLTAAWGGPRTPLSVLLDDDGGLRVPFPSTSTLAAQAYLCEVATRPEVAAEMAEVVRQAEAAGLPRTSFVRALRSLSETGLVRGSTGRRFLEYEAEMMVFPEVVASELRQAEKNTPRRNARDKRGELIDETRLRALKTAVTALRRAATAAKITSPGSQIAVIAVDGDSIRKALLGTGTMARWQDVLHPDVVEAVKRNPITLAAGWGSLLGKRRLMGPSIHAFVNRVLASFAHVLVPWVVEREFDGRLVYAGGDDVLALASAGQALGIAERLSRLYRAGWVRDTQPDESPWSWRKKDAKLSPWEARSRFEILEALPEEGAGIPAPDSGDLLPMMGAGRTLSAGIALGHYKTPLGQLVQAAREELERAKERSAKDAFSVRRFSRGGEKAVLRLGFPEVASVEETIQAFRTGKLAARLPYKLREVEQVVFGAWKHEIQLRGEADARTRAQDFAAMLFENQAGAGHAGAFHLWWAGLAAAWDASRQGEGAGGSEQGLSVCRYLAALGQEEEES